DVWRARVLREVRVEGLPLAILETDLMKRVFLRTGEPLDEDEAVVDEAAAERQRKRDAAAKDAAARGAGADGGPLDPKDPTSGIDDDDDGAANDDAADAALERAAAAEGARLAQLVPGADAGPEVDAEGGVTGAKGAVDDEHLAKKPKRKKGRD